MNKKERREYHKRWRSTTDREKFLEGQRRRHRKWYYAHLEHAREKGKINQRKYVASHREKIRERMGEYHRKWTARNKRFVNAYKTAMACIDCGIADPVVLDLDHVRGRKVKRIANMAGQGWSLLTIVRELEKCEVRCANCHRIRHNTGENRG